MFDIKLNLVMNTSQVIHDDLQTVLLFVYVVLCVILSIFYSLWSVYLMKEILYLRKKLWRINHGSRDYETDALYSKYRSEYFKCILMLLVTISEGLLIFPHPVRYMIQAIYRGEDTYDVVVIFTQVVCWSLFTILLSAMLYLLNLLTLYQINLLYGTFDINLLKRKLRNLLILSIILLLMTCTLFASIISQLIALVHTTYYMVRLFKNCKYLYTLLKYRYTDSLLNHNNVPLHRAQMKIALRYKYFNIFLLTGLCILLAASWSSLVCVLPPIVKYIKFRKWIDIQAYVYILLLASTSVIEYILGFLVVIIIVPTLVVFTLSRL